MLVSLGTQTRMYTAAQSKETPMEHASCFHMQELLSLSLIRAPQRTRSNFASWKVNAQRILAWHWLHFGRDINNLCCYYRVKWGWGDSQFEGLFHIHNTCVNVRVRKESSHSDSRDFFMMHHHVRDACWIIQLTFCLFIFPQKRKRREKDDSDAVSLCSVDFKVKHIIWHFALINDDTTSFHTLIQWERTFFMNINCHFGPSWDVIYVSLIAPVVSGGRWMPAISEID